MLALLSGAQQFDAQSVFFVQMKAQVPPFVVTHVCPVQQSYGVTHAAPAPLHVFEQKPIGAQAICPVLESVAQQPEAHPAGSVQGAAQNECSITFAGAMQIPEQHAFGVLVQSELVARHVVASLALSLLASDAPESVRTPASAPTLVNATV